jgi:lipoprotein NlpI
MKTQKHTQNMRSWVVLGLVVAALSGCEARRELDHSLVQQDAAAVQTSTNDESVVTIAFGSTTVNMENLKAYIRARSLNDIGIYGETLMFIH